MLDLSVKVNDRRILRMMKRFPKEMSAATNEGLRAAGNLVIRQAKINLVSLRARKFGILSASLGQEIDQENHITRIGPKLEAKGTGSNESPKSYGYFVEFGRAPGKMPPASSFVLYAKRYGTGDTADPDKAAFLIARAIGRRGTRPKPFLGPALEKNEAKIRLLIDKALSEAVRRLES